MTLVLEVHDFKKNYCMGKVVVPALCGVSFDVEEGKFLTIFGPSDSGKSTLLHLIGCLDRPDEGEILIDGSNVLKLSDDKLAELRLTKMGFVFQFFNLLKIDSFGKRRVAVNNSRCPRRRNVKKSQGNVEACRS